MSMTFLTKGKGDYQIEYIPAPRITEADKTNDKKLKQYLKFAGRVSHAQKQELESELLMAFKIWSLQRTLDRRLYLLLYGNTYGAPSGKPVWHFPGKVFESEETLHKCAESALKSVIGDLSDTYFVGNAPMGHMVMQPTKNVPEPCKEFFFKSQVIATNKFNIGKCKDFVWITKDELLEYIPEQAKFLNKMIIS
ncbi:hypothetical protein SLEP1_g2395 [Rubroshorea leprosula]|uniref:Large ribosomal subunit protein mL46 n=1 Tax=Rubroshorea leprosula TaxID=152421 RepID=A0AAV5HSU8_9ROSI|nr:hypothetical protein SLEP1_g2395 [Rubroshorea leprosula]